MDALIRVILAGMLGPVLLGAQAPVPPAPAPRTAAWVDVGLSAGTYGSLGAALAFTRIGPSRHWRARIHAQGNEPWGAPATFTVRTFGEASLQFGRPVGPCGRNWCGVYFGPAYVELTAKQPMQDIESDKTVGVSAEAIIVSRRFPHLTFGGFANLNPVAPYAGVMLSMALGKVPQLERDLPILRH